MSFSLMRVARAVLLLSLVMSSTARAQSPQATLVDDLVQRVVNAVNDLRYEDAIRDGREILVSSSSLRPQQEVTLRFALAAAHFPESDGTQRPDTALAHLERVLRLAPETEALPVVLAWRGLDSLFTVARTRGLYVALRPAMDSFVVVGTASSPAIPVVASRPARFRLSTRRIGGAEVTHSASSTPSARVELTLRAVDGGRAVLERGEYELIVTAVDPQRGDSAQSVRRLIVDGAAPTLMPVPMLDSARLRPESRTPRPWHIAAAGGTMALATFFIADGMRATGTIATATTSDSRAGLVGLSILGATGWAIWKDRAGTDPDAVTANDAVRSLHERSVDAATSENTRRLSAHRVTVKIAGEGR